VIIVRSQIEGLATHLSNCRLLPIFTPVFSFVHFAQEKTEMLDFEKVNL